MPDIRHSPEAPTRTRAMAPGERIDAHRHDDHQVAYAGSGVLAVTTDAGTWFAPAPGPSGSPPAASTPTAPTAPTGISPCICWTCPPTPGADDVPVTTVAHHCGRSSTSAFIDVFHRAPGYTPGTRNRRP